MGTKQARENQNLSQMKQHGSDSQYPDTIFEGGI